MIVTRVGEKHGRLLVVRLHSVRAISGNVMWVCLCDCGKETLSTYGSLKSKNKQSCGCLSKEIRTVHGMRDTPVYDVWAAIKSRCNNMNNPNYHSYGGRGVKLKYKNFKEFHTDVGDRPSSKHEIDRENNEGNYEKGNCRWVMHKTNSQNTRRSKHWFINGVKYNSKRHAAEVLGVDDRTIVCWCNGYTQNGKTYPQRPNCWSELKYASTK